MAGLKGKKPGKGKKGKKGSKGKKGAKGKKKGSKKTKKPQVPVKSIAKVQRYVFEDIERFLAYLSELDLNLPLYVLFRSDQASVIDRVIEEGIMKFINYIQQDPDSKDIIFTTVGINSERLDTCVLRLSPKIRLERLPTLVRWGGPEKLDGEDRCMNQDLLCLLFEDKERRRQDCYGRETHERFTDNNKILCPSLPSPEEQAAPPPPPASPKPKKKKKGKKKKGKGKSKKKKGGKKGKKKGGKKK